MRGRKKMQWGWRNSVYSLLACLSSYGERVGLYRKYKELDCTISPDGHLAVPPFCGDHSSHRLAIYTDPPRFAPRASSWSVL